MRALQFWILLLASSFVSILLIRQVFLSRELNQEQRMLVDSQETAANGPYFENAWKQLALHIYQVGHQDPALVEVLKSERVAIHANPAAGGSTTVPTPPGAPASSKTPVAPIHPAAP